MSVQDSMEWIEWNFEDRGGKQHVASPTLVTHAQTMLSLADLAAACCRLQVFTFSTVVTDGKACAKVCQMRMLQSQNATVLSGYSDTL